jgi:hypothetical protein
MEAGFTRPLQAGTVSESDTDDRDLWRRREPYPIPLRALCVLPYFIHL